MSEPGPLFMGEGYYCEYHLKYIGVIMVGLTPGFSQPRESDPLYEGVLILIWLYR
ncbi:hypothetical protein ACGTN9_06985 [Halobacillus sp. MO56]